MIISKDEITSQFGGAERLTLHAGTVMPEIEYLYEDSYSAPTLYILMSGGMAASGASQTSFKGGLPVGARLKNLHIHLRG